MSAPPRRRVTAPDVAAPDKEGPSGGRRAGLGAIAVLAAAVALGAVVWSRVSDTVGRGEESVLLPGAIALRGQAPWVKADIRAEALRAASLDRGLPLHDPELANRLARAFDMHPWVRRVVRVDLRHPAAATVEIECREPAAMVGVSGGLLAVDAEGVVLPSVDFTAESAATYPRLAGIDSSPQGPEGARWGDPAVEEGAALAHVIAPEWAALRLVECRPVVAAGVRTWELVDADGRTILFGSAPGREAPGEPTAATKIARLRTLPEGGEQRVDLSLPAASP
jgi:hypothetical protein